MKYLSDEFALNVSNSLNTCGDWHASALDWSKIKLRESSESVFGYLGIELNKSIPDHDDKYNVADDLRAILDIMADGRTRYLKGFRDDFLCTDEYNQILSEKVLLLKDSEHWNDIKELMKREFMWEWDKFIQEVS